MTRTAPFLLALSALAASMVHAELKYIAYDLTTGSAAEVIAPDVKADIYHGSTMLFVQDSAVSSDYYMGVFEVTQAQAEVLRWTTSVTSGATAFATKTDNSNYDFANAFPVARPLSFPSVAQWQAYAGSPAKPCNVFQGLDSLVASGPFSLSSWWTNYKDKIKANAHGVFDAFGNVAEYTTDAKAFYGGYADATCTFESLSASTATPANAVPERLLGARLVYTPPAEQTYTVAVTLDGTEVSKNACKAGVSVTVTPPSPANGYKQFGPDITPASVTGSPFVMPAENVTFAYTSKPYVVIHVDGGTASTSEACVGDSITLTATASSKYQAFKGWTGAATSDQSPFSYVIPDTVTPGETLTFTAEYQTYPRVLVYGGTATIDDSSGEAKGDGYYTPATTLKLIAADVSGYKLKEWTGASLISGQYYTVGAFNAPDVTLTATYELDPGAPQPEGITVHVGPKVETKTQTTETTDPDTGKITTETTKETIITERPPFGYNVLALTQKNWPLGGNTYVSHPFNDVSEKGTLGAGLGVKYAHLNLADGTVSYDLLPKEPTAALPLKLVSNSFYLGVYETTVANVEYSKEETDRIKSELTNVAVKGLSKNTATLPDGGYFAWLNKTFAEADVNASIPSQADYRAALNGETQKTIVRAIGFQAATYNPNALQLPTTANGFYHVQGNYGELIGANTYCGGSVYETSDTNCTVERVNTITTANSRWAFRPKIPKGAPVNVTIEGIKKEEASVLFPVRKGAEVDLGTPVMAGKTFNGWKVNGEAVAMPAIVQVDTHFTPEWEAAQLSVAYVGCSGPATVVPGLTTQVYLEPGKVLKTLTVEPAELASVDQETSVVTFATGKSGTVTITAVYDETKPGYSLRLR